MPDPQPVAAHSSIVGGSSAGRVLACPGSIPLVASLPPPPSSGYAEEGTALHEAMAHLLLRDLEPTAVLGLRFNGYAMTEELVYECLVPCVAAFDDIVGNHEFEVEVRAPFPDIPGAFGTADVAYYDDASRLIGVIDWKFGAGVPVQARGNAQLKFYLQAMRGRGPARETVRGYIVQPRHEYCEGDTFTLAELDAFATELLLAVKRQEGLHEGPHCRWCPAVGICPAKHSHLVTLGQLSDLAAELPHLLHLADQAELVISEIRALALDALEHGQKVDGWKLVAKRGTRHWAVSQKMLTRRLRTLTGRKDLSVLKEPELLSPAQVEKLIKPHPLPGGLTTAASSGNTMAPEDDPRPAVMSAANLRRLAEMQATR